MRGGKEEGSHWEEKKTLFVLLWLPCVSQALFLALEARTYHAHWGRSSTSSKSASVLSNFSSCHHHLLTSQETAHMGQAGLKEKGTWALTLLACTASLRTLRADTLRQKAAWRGILHRTGLDLSLLSSVSFLEWDCHPLPPYLPATTAATTTCPLHTTHTKTPPSSSSSSPFSHTSC